MGATYEQRESRVTRRPGEDRFSQTRFYRIVGESPEWAIRNAEGTAQGTGFVMLPTMHALYPEGEGLEPNEITSLNVRVRELRPTWFPGSGEDSLVVVTYASGPTPEFLKATWSMETTGVNKVVYTDRVSVWLPKPTNVLRTLTVLRAMWRTWGIPPALKLAWRSSTGLLNSSTFLTDYPARTVRFMGSKIRKITGENPSTLQGAHEVILDFQALYAWDEEGELAHGPWVKEYPSPREDGIGWDFEYKNILGDIDFAILFGDVEYLT